jgi:hypothetical protein
MRGYFVSPLELPPNLSAYQCNHTDFIIEGQLILSQDVLRVKEIREVF